MLSDKKAKEFIEAIQKTDLSYDEARIYFTLIQHGKKGTYVKDLVEHLDIERTTTYSILKRLISKGCVIESEQTNAPKKAKTFVAVEPTKYFNLVLINKKRELEELEEASLMVTDRLEAIYQKGEVFLLEDIDLENQAFLKPLLENGWKILSRVEEKEINVYGYDIFDYELRPAKFKFVDTCGFLLLKFNYEIETDKTAIQFHMGQFKRKMEAEVKYKADLKNFRILESEIDFFGIIFPALNLETKFPPNKSYQEISKAVVLPIKSKVFALWAESYEILEEMVRVIFKIEKLPLKK